MLPLRTYFKIWFLKYDLKDLIIYNRSVIIIIYSIYWFTLSRSKKKKKM